MSHENTPRTVSELRRVFLDYFQKRGHEVVPSSSLIPSNDPTLLFTNAGMVPFKDVFLGSETRPYARATSAQVCLRAGGKHNDLENVGYTARHHTCFEMLGNFSFGDYFKREAIQHAWTFLTDVLKLPPERLWVTVYQEDDEAANIWLNEIGVSKERFSRCGEKDNFWSMGDTGPCGPCTEIFYDHGEHIFGGPPGSKDAEADRYVEIWNLVFMQYHRDVDGKLHALPKPSVDTGMGIERIAAVMQGVHNNFDIDLFQALIDAILHLSPDVSDRTNPSVRVIADHIRAVSFLIAEGVSPSNEGRGYVLRRIIRRAVRHGKKLGLSSPFLNKLVSPLVNVMGETYSLLLSRKSHIERVLEEEENRFQMTLDAGLRVFHEAVKDFKRGDVLPGYVAFKLYDTYGFPLDLTEDLAREYEFLIDHDGFQVSMTAQREQSQASSRFQQVYEVGSHAQDASEFCGYTASNCQGEVLAIYEKGQKCNTAPLNVPLEIVLNQTPFYAEGGGQVGDTGELHGPSGKFIVEDTISRGNTIVHRGFLKEGILKVNEEVTANINESRRNAIRRNHTATHLVHRALKEILGDHVEQKGSLVRDARARFDFSHSMPLTQKEIDAIESLCQQKILENIEVITRTMPFDEAKKLGAVALFGEKYGNDVRVLSIGDFSIELCGGTHVSRTGDIGFFKIVGETGIAGGIRRIEIVTGEFAVEWIHEKLHLLSTIAGMLKTDVSQLKEKLEQFLESRKILEKELNELQYANAEQLSRSFLSEVKPIEETFLLVKQVMAKGNILKVMVDQLRELLPNGVIVLYVIENKTLQVVVGIGKLTPSYVPPAATFVNALCGKGGGRRELAQGGSVLPNDFDIRIANLNTLIVRPQSD